MPNANEGLISRPLACQKNITKGIHDIVNDQGFAMHYRAIQTWSAIWKFSDVRESIYMYSKAKGWIDFFSYVECFRSKDLSILFSRRT